MNRVLMIFCILSVIGLALFAAQNVQISNVAAVIGSSQKIVFAECITQFSDLSISSFEIEQANINEDNIKDAVVQYKNGEECGTAGCVFELCISNDQGGFDHVTFGYAAKKLSVQNTRTNGMTDLMLNDDKNTRMTWDGSKYQLSQ